MSPPRIRCHIVGLTALPRPSDALLPHPSDAPPRAPRAGPLPAGAWKARTLGRAPGGSRHHSPAGGRLSPGRSAGRLGGPHRAPRHPRGQGRLLPLAGEGDGNGDRARSGGGSAGGSTGWPPLDGCPPAAARCHRCQLHALLRRGRGRSGRPAGRHLRGLARCARGGAGGGGCARGCAPARRPVGHGAGTRALAPASLPPGAKGHRPCVPRARGRRGGAGTACTRGRHARGVDGDDGAAHAGAAAHRGGPRHACGDPARPSG